MKKRRKSRKLHVDWPSATGPEMLRALKRLGFKRMQKGVSHKHQHYMHYPGTPEIEAIQVPEHGKVEYSKHFVKQMWKQANKLTGVSAADFLKALR